VVTFVAKLLICKTSNQWFVEGANRWWDSGRY